MSFYTISHVKNQVTAMAMAVETNRMYLACGRNIQVFDSKNLNLIKSEEIVDEEVCFLHVSSNNSLLVAATKSALVFIKLEKNGNLQITNRIDINPLTHITQCNLALVLSTSTHIHCYQLSKQNISEHVSVEYMITALAIHHASGFITVNNKGVVRHWPSETLDKKTTDLCYIKKPGVGLFDSPKTLYILAKNAIFCFEHSEPGKLPQPSYTFDFNLQNVCYFNNTLLVITENGLYDVGQSQDLTNSKEGDGSSFSLALLGTRCVYFLTQI